MAPLARVEGLRIHNTFLHTMSDEEMDGEEDAQPTMPRAKTLPNASVRLGDEALAARSDDKANCAKFAAVLREVLSAETAPNDPDRPAREEKEDDREEAENVHNELPHTNTNDWVEEAHNELPHTDTNDWFDGTPVERHEPMGTPEEGHSGGVQEQQRFGMEDLQQRFGMDEAEGSGSTSSSEDFEQPAAQEPQFISSQQPQFLQVPQYQPQPLGIGAAISMPIFIVPALSMPFPASPSGAVPFVQSPVAVPAASTEGIRFVQPAPCPAPERGPGLVTGHAGWGSPVAPPGSPERGHAGWGSPVAPGGGMPSAPGPTLLTATIREPRSQAKPPSPWGPGDVQLRTDKRPQKPQQVPPSLHLARTTVMLRNLPNNYTRIAIVEMIDAEGFAGKYDFLYFPIDFRTHAALGYAFLNLVTPEDAEAFHRRFNGYSRWSLPSSKVCSVGWSFPHQGLESHIARYRNSPLMHESVPDAYRPVLFRNGVRVPFPPPTKKIKPPRQGTERMLV